MSLTFRPGVYLHANPPKRKRGQFTVGRRSVPKPVIVIHTAESKTDRAGDDPTAESVARWTVKRNTPGSYHLIGDRDSIIQLVDYANEAYHDGTGSNRWSIGMSLAMRAKDWPTLTPEHREQFIFTAATMAVHAARWLESNGYGTPAAKFLTRAESEQPNASGFISHGRRDPKRRTDPGVDFPWNDFLAAYTALLKGQAHTIPSPEGATTVSETNVKAIQQALVEAGEASKVGGNYVDGDLGPTTTSDIKRALTALSVLRDGSAKHRDRIAELEGLNVHLQSTLDETRGASVGASADAVLGKQFRDLLASAGR